MNKKVRILLLFCGMVSVLLSGCIKTEHPTSINNFTDFQVFSVKELYPEALASAKKWMNDAYLHRVSVDVSPKTTNLESLFVFFTFRTYTSQTKYFSYEYIFGEGIEVKQQEGEFSVPRPHGIELHPITLPIDSPEAFKIMYNELGRNFYQRCKRGEWPLFLSLEQELPSLGEGELVWKISFLCDEPEDNVAIFINAKTGEILEIRE